jgi:hypothetical protein
MKIEHDEVCEDCKGTGLYVGFAEKDGAAVVCHTCKGTGCFHFVHTYEPFVRRIKRNGIKRVFASNPGICIGENESIKLTDFGGMDSEEWEKGNRDFIEDRKHLCPSWYYQSVDYNKKPNWAECGFGAFSSCKHFCNKDKCWDRWDKEYGKA